MIYWKKISLIMFGLDKFILFLLIFLVLGHVRVIVTVLGGLFVIVD
jgi:hypothetical protein